MPFKRQALVEFEDIESSKKCVTFAAEEPVYIAGQQAFFNYSTSKRITRPGNTDDPSGGNKVLLLSIQNPLYPITVVCYFYALLYFNTLHYVQTVGRYKHSHIYAYVLSSAYNNLFHAGSHCESESIVFSIKTYKEI